jgi:hypothetical protein
MTARVRRFDARAVFDEEVAGVRIDLEAVQRGLAEQPAFRSWLPFCRRDDRSIAPANAEEEDQKPLKQYKRGDIHKIVGVLREMREKERRSKS